MNSREAFEKWRNPKTLDLAGTFDDWMGRYKYHHSHIDAMWQSWQASRNQLLAELRGKMVVLENTPQYAKAKLSDIYSGAIKDCLAILDAAKGE